MGFIGAATSASIGWLKRAAAAGSTLLNDLVAYWPLDEVSGTRYDAVGSNDLTDNNTVGVSLAGPSGTVASFVGGNNESLSKASVSFTADYTIAGWVNITDDGNMNYFFSCGGWTDTVQVALAGRFDAPNTGAFQATIGDGSGYKQVSGASLAGGWHLVVASYDSATKAISVYVDTGSAATSDALAGASRDATAATLYLGNFTDGSSYDLNGKMARWGYWSRVLSSDERTSLFNSGAGKAYADLTAAEKVNLVSYWDLSETSGTRADAHGSNDLTDNNTVGSVVNAGAAMHNGAASFVAANTENLSSTAFPPPTEITVSAWAKFSVVSGGKIVVSHDENGVGGLGRDWVMQLSGANFTALVFNNVGGLVQATDTGTTIVTDTWYHLMMWWDSSDGKLRVSVNNGTIYASDALADRTTANDSTLRIGATQGGSSQNIDGLIDEVAIWSRVLTEDERTELWNLGKGKYYDFSG